MIGHHLRTLGQESLPGQWAGWEVTKMLSLLPFTIPMEKKCKRAKWLSVEALQIAVKRGEKQRRKGKI